MPCLFHQDLDLCQHLLNFLYQTSKREGEHYASLVTNTSWDSTFLVNTVGNGCFGSSKSQLCTSAKDLPNWRFAFRRSICCRRLGALASLAKTHKFFLGILSEECWELKADYMFFLTLHCRGVATWHTLSKASVLSQHHGCRCSWKVADFRNLTPCTNSKYSKNKSSTLATQTISIDAMASHVSDTDFYFGWSSYVVIK